MTKMLGRQRLLETWLGDYSKHHGHQIYIRKCSIAVNTQQYYGYCVERRVCIEHQVGNLHDHQVTTLHDLS